MNIIANLFIITYTIFLKLTKDNQLKEYKYSKYIKANPTLNIVQFTKIHSSKSKDAEY